jgi:hypothetical protein
MSTKPRTIRDTLPAILSGSPVRNGTPRADLASTVTAPIPISR